MRAASPDIDFDFTIPISESVRTGGTKHKYADHHDPQYILTSEAEEVDDEPSDIGNYRPTPPAKLQRMTTMVCR